MPSPRPSISMKDVAALAGVSLGTVSNVLNSPALVSDATRSRVEKAIAKLGWVRNESARQLRAGRSRSIGMVVMDIANPFFTDIVSGVEDYVHDLGYSVQLGNSAQQDRARGGAPTTLRAAPGTRLTLRPDQASRPTGCRAAPSWHSRRNRRPSERGCAILLGVCRRCRGRAASG